MKGVIFRGKGMAVVFKSLLSLATDMRESLFTELHELNEYQEKHDPIQSLWKKKKME